VRIEKRGGKRERATDGRRRGDGDAGKIERRR
jgi:hypothetical protein